MAKSDDDSYRRKCKAAESTATRKLRYDWNIANVFQASTDFIDRHLQLFRTGVTVTGCVGLAFIIRSTRMYSKFIHINDIPRDFVRKNVRLRGKILSVEDTHLLVEHLPIIDLQRFTFAKGNVTGLNVYLAGVSLLDGSQKCLRSHVRDNQLTWFTILAIDGHLPGIQAIVTIKKKWWQTTNLNEALLRSGFGKTTALPPLSNQRLSVKVTQRLLKAELAAEKANKGVWERESTLDRLKGVVCTSWNGSVRFAKGIVDVGSKVIAMPVTGFRRIRHIFQRLKKK